MKKTEIGILSVILLLFLSVMPAHAQSKKDLEDEVKQKTAIIDSLNIRITNLEKESKAVDSMAVRLKSLEVMYNAIKDKRLKEDFDPNDFVAILDSAVFANDSIIKTLTTDDKMMLDSIGALNTRVVELDKVVDNCVVMMNMISDSEDEITRDEVEKGLGDDREQVIHELKQLKELFDSGILTKKEFDDKKKQVLEKW